MAWKRGELTLSGFARIDLRSSEIVLWVRHCVFRFEFET